MASISFIKTLFASAAMDIFLKYTCQCGVYFQGYYELTHYWELSVGNLDSICLIY